MSPQPLRSREFSLNDDGMKDYWVALASANHIAGVEVDTG
jgi:hypothetical protein